ncbi:MAG TPA: Holliday junction resolvase RuvX [Candidatus Limnocylindrales bacterium]|nr:Holliday junction resolvase RuvX [Candidatus Limnocylindrales bacterium]
MRVLGVDVGERRVGLAVSDPTGTVATPLETLARRAGKRFPLSRLEEIARGHEVEHVVVGLPLDLRGQEDDWCAEVRDVGRRLGERLGVEVSFVDERLTSVRAERTVRSLGLGKRQREDKGRVDAAAAQLILQAWLDQPGVAR